jgi:hypothetical protein
MMGFVRIFTESIANSAYRNLLFGWRNVAEIKVEQDDDFIEVILIRKLNIVQSFYWEKFCYFEAENYSEILCLINLEIFNV